MRKTTLMALLSGGAIAIITPFQAVKAQAAEVPDGNRESTQSAGNVGPDSASNTATAEDQAITITGSRLITNGNNSPTPVTVVSAQELTTTTPSNVYDGLSKLPAFLPSGGQRITGKADANNSGSFLDLRGLGSNRLLVLFDGRRVPPTTTNGSVDTSILPQMLMERVEVVTGGASAVYGSDAVSGVVNYIIDRRFDGLRVQGQAGIASRGDAARQRLGVAAGTGLLGDRAHIMGSFEYYNSDGIENAEARENSSRYYCTTGNGSAALPLQTELEDCRLTLQTLGGLIRSGPLANFQFDSAGRLVPFVVGLPTNTATTRIGGDGVRPSGLPSILAALRTYQAFGRFDFDITDDVHFYAQGSYNQSRSSNNYNLVYLFDVRINRDNAYLPSHLTPAELAAINAGPSSDRAFNFGRRMVDIPNFSTRSETDNVFFNSGLSGSLGEFRWDFSYVFGRNDQKVTNVANPNVARMFAAIDAVRSPTGEIVCRVTLTNPGLFPGCQPLDIFGQGFASREAWAWTRNDTDFTLTQTMHDFQGSISGTLFNNWAGPVRVALSGEYRDMKLVNSTDFPTRPASCVGLSTTTCGTSTYQLEYLEATTSRANASQSVREGAVELSIPLLSDFLIARDLNVNLAGRYTDYSSVGSVTTWKVGIDWQITDDLRFRGTRSRDIRAPTLYDLAGPVSIGTTAFTDQHILSCPAIDPNCANPAPLLGATTTSTQGNPGLQPEKADTLTFGVVYQPHWLPRLSISVDYYEIDIANAIATLSGVNNTVQTLCEASNGASVYCSLYVRPLPFSDRTPANFPTTIIIQPVNVARTRTYGIDGEINYSFAALGGEFRLRGLVSYQPTFTTVQFPNEPIVELAGVADRPEWRAVGFVSYRSGPFTISTQTRWRSSVRYTRDPRINTVGIPTVGAVSFTDINLSFRLPRSTAQDAEIFLNIENAFDTNPPVYSSGGASASLQSDSILGRYFTAGFRLHF